MACYVHDNERVLTPPDAEDLLLRISSEQTVSPLSMDVVYDPPPVMQLRGRAGAVTTEKEPVLTCATVLLRAMCASHEPSLTPRESLQWSAHVVARIIGRLARAHQTPEVFDPVVVAMNQVEVELQGGSNKSVWHPFRFALGWLLLDELQREPNGAGTVVSTWAKQLAERIAGIERIREVTDEATRDEDEDEDEDEFSRTLFGPLLVPTRVCAAQRKHFGV